MTKLGSVAVEAGQEHLQLLGCLVLQDPGASTPRECLVLRSLVKPVGDVCMLQVAQLLGLYPETAAGSRLPSPSSRPHLPIVSVPCSLLSHPSHLLLRVQRVSIPWLMDKTLKPATGQWSFLPILLAWSGDISLSVCREV